MLCSGEESDLLMRITVKNGTDVISDDNDNEDDEVVVCRSG